MVVRVQLFGALRKFAGQQAEGVIEVEMPADFSAGELREVVKKTLDDKFGAKFSPALIDRAALADEKEILGTSRKLSSSGTFALLPPVCGG